MSRVTTARDDARVESLLGYSNLHLTQRIVDVMDALEDAAHVFSQINVIAYELEQLEGQPDPEYLAYTTDLIIRYSVGGHGNAIGMLEEGRPV